MQLNRHNRISFDIHPIYSFLIRNQFVRHEIFECSELLGTFGFDKKILICTRELEAPNARPDQVLYRKCTSVT